MAKKKKTDMQTEKKRNNETQISKVTAVVCKHRQCITVAEYLTTVANPNGVGVEGQSWNLHTKLED